MSAPQQLGIVTVVGTLVAYVASHKLQRPIQLAVVVALWASYLSCLQQDEDAFFSQDAMVQSVMVFIMPLKLTQQILFPTTTATAAAAEELSWMGLASFVGSFFYYALPISRTTSQRNETKENNNRLKRPSLGQLVLQTMEYACVIAFKLALLPVLDAAASQILAQQQPNSNKMDHNDVSSPTYWILLVLCCSSMLAGNWIMDLQAMLIGLVSGGHLEMLPMHNYVILSISLGELWSRRYNLLIHTLLKETVYRPVRSHLGYSAPVARMAAFGMSGILHAWVAYMVFGQGMIRAMVFFVVQVPWMVVVESSDAWKHRWPMLAKRILTMTFFLGTLPLYVGLFVEAYPQWLEKNPPPAINVSVLIKLSQFLAGTLGIEDGYLRIPS